MTGLRLVLVIVAIAALAAAAWFFMKGRSEFEAAEKVMQERWSVWTKTGIVDDAKLAVFRQDPNWTTYAPHTAGVTSTPFHDEFGNYLRRTKVMNTRASIALAGLGLVVLVCALALRPQITVAPPPTVVT